LIRKPTLAPGQKENGVNRITRIIRATALRSMGFTEGANPGSDFQRCTSTINAIASVIFAAGMLDRPGMSSPTRPTAIRMNAQKPISSALRL
jgi:hypothetical protein